MFPSSLVIQIDRHRWNVAKHLWGDNCQTEGGTAILVLFVKGCGAYPENVPPPECILSQLEQFVSPMGMLWIAKRTQNIWSA